MRRGLLLLLSLCVSLLLYAQDPVRFGDRDVYLEANVRAQLRGRQHVSSLELGTPTGARLNLLVQFGSEQRNYEALKQKGIELGDYLGNNAYYAQVLPGSRPSDFVGTGLRTVVPIRGEWKVVGSLLQGNAPEWAVAGDNLKVSVAWFDGVTPEQVKADLSKRGLNFGACSEMLRNVEVTGTREQILALADAEYVAFVSWAEPPMEFNNYRGARLSGATNLRMSPQLGGRGLTGEGVRLGIWDGNVEDHVDYGNRVHRQEFELGQAAAGGHGMHTTGTILGAGLLDEKARGMAPEAQIWTWNFNKQSNGKTVQQEMLESYEKYNISITSNSYGFRMSALCKAQQYLTYTFLGNPATDLLAYYIPTLTHCYSAGNDQKACQQAFGHATNYAKNIISVGALKVNGDMTTFSSFGPLRDGRMFPIICARGDAVYSVMPEQSYGEMGGTSMSCPTTAGHLALLTQRWGQLHGGALPYNYYLKALIANTADDGGNVGPDYKFGFGILNSLAAVKAMESNWHHLVSLEKGGAAQTKAITVPAGVKELRVMICWNDPVAKKEYALGDSPLVNDLDLTVLSGSTTYYPYTLDPKKPNALAVATQKNAVDNIEQVVIKDPTAGTYTINVAGTVNQGDKQDYAVVWYFDYQKPAITSPMAGDVYAPGLPIFLRTENLVTPLKVEYSTNAGETFSNLAASATTACISLNLPKAIKPTNKATIRVTDAKGTTVQMQGLFSIMSFVTGVKLEDKSCSTTGWKLTWDAAANAEKYEILQADINKGSYSVIATVDKPAVEYPIPAEKILDGRNIFAVRALSATGIAGQRSVGILSPTSRPAVLTEAMLPYLESFVGSPFQHVSLTTGKNLKFTLLEALVGLKLPFDSHMLQWIASKKATSWDDPFAQTDNVAKVSTCQLDLSNIPAGTPIQLLTFYYMTKTENPNGSLLRLTVNGNVVPDVFNRTQIPGDGESHNLAWDLTEYAGQKIAVNLEAALETNKNGIVLVHYRVMKKSTKPDVGIAWANDPEIVAKNKMGEEDVNFSVLNYSSVELKDVPVTVQVDGEVAYTHRIETMKPFEDVILSFKHNFESVQPHKFNVTVRVDVKDDERPANNEYSFEVYNMGNGIVMPEVSYIQFWGMILPQVPRVTETLSGKATFTDGRGALEPYKEQEQAVLQVLPTKPNAAVQVRFKQRAFNKGDTVFVFTGQVPSNLNINITKASYKVTDVSSDPLTFISEADNGGITFAFVGASGEQNDGWLAELAEIPMSNQWKLKELREAKGADDNHNKLEAVVENLIDHPFHNVGIYFTINGEEKRFEIPILNPKSETIFALPKEIDVTAPMRMYVEAKLAKDGDITDNSKTLSILHDPIWEGGGTIKNYNDLIINVVEPQDVESVVLRGSPRVVYRPDVKIPLYTQTKSKIKFVLSRKPRTELLPSAIRVFIDLNGDNQLDDAASSKEMLKADLVTNTTNYTVDVDLSAIPDLQAGKRRMRIILATDDNYTKFKNKEEIDWGHVVDFIADIKTGNSPVELGIISFVDLQSGRSNLTDQTPIKVQIRNNGHTPVSKVKLTCKIDELDEFEEELDCDIQPQAAGVVEFSKKGDFSAEGKHTVKVALKEKDANEKDNERTINFFKIPPQTDKLYSLAFVGDRTETVALPNIGKDLDVDVTIEGWWKLNEKHSCAFYDGGESGINLGVLVGNARYPDNTLVFFVGSNGVYISKKPAVEPGKWQHIAIVAHSPTYVDAPTLYVDGEKIELERQGTGGFSFNTLWLNIQMKGQNAMCRVWNSKRTQEQLKDNMVKSVRDSDGNLPTECKGEFIYTEGKGLLSSTAQKGEYARIISERPDNTIWIPLDRILKNVEIANAADVQFVTENEIKVLMPQGFAAYDKVKVKFILNWSGTVVKQGAQIVTDETELDFSANDHKLSFTLENTNFFGKKISETITIQLANDLSNACDLLSLSIPKAKNPGLKEDLKADNPQQIIEFAPENESPTSTFNYRDMVLVVSNISPDAELYQDAKKLDLNSDIHIDFSQPLVLKVLAQNKRDAKFYTIRLSLPNDIVWDATKIERVYTGTPLPLDAKASSELPITYTSSAPTIATVDGEGNLVTVAVGTATITAKQEGNDVFKPAEEKTREVEVKHAALTIKVKPATMAQGDALPEFEFEYDGLAFPNTEWQFEASYEVRLADNTVWNPTMPPLAQGTYTIAPKDYTEPYEKGNYKITRENGTLTVTAPKDAKNVTFTTKDEANAALGEVALQIGDMNAVTTADGTYQVLLRPGKYTVTATKAGYTTDTKAFEVTDTELSIDLKLLKEVYTLTYTANEHGMIQGRSPQKVAAGRDGEEVVALAKDLKHRFVKWSDDNKNAVRTDKGVDKDITVQAIFEAFTYTLTYEVGEGGEFDPATTPVTQQVVPGENATPVTVKAKEGYVFLKWSDGVNTPTRTDQNVMKSFTVKALFFRPLPIAWSEDFELGSASLEGWEFDHPLTGLGWHLMPLSTITTIVNPKGNAVGIFPSSENARPRYTDTWVATPWLSLDGKAADAGIAITYSRYKSSNNKAKLQYRFGDGDWQDARELTYAGSMPETYTLDKDKLAGHKYVRFRWIFTNTYVYSCYLAIDDISVKFDPEPLNEIVLQYFAGEHGMLQKVGETEKVKRLRLTTTTGTDGDEVAAVPDAGYKFVKWSDDLMTEKRKDKEAVRVEAIFEAIPKPTYIIKYLADANGKIEGRGYQVLEEGEETSSVTAVANTGYSFKQWDDGKKDNPRMDVVGTENKTYTAQFAQYFTLTYVAGDHGTIEGDATQTVEAGGTGTPVTAKANDGYRFVKWDDGKTDNPRTDANVAESKTYTAEFVQVFTLTYVAGDHGTIEGDATQTVEAGGSGTPVTAKANDGYRFVKWDDGKTDNPRTDANVTESKTYTAEFVQVFTLTYVAGDHGTIEGDATQTVEAGGSGTPVTAKANDGYRFVKWDDGKTDNPRTDANVTESKTYTAEFEQIPPTTFAVTLAKEGEGELTITGIEADKLNAVPENTALTAIATPANGWELQSLMAGDKDIKSDGKFTVTADVEVKAVFVKKTAPNPPAPQPTTFAVTLAKEGEGTLTITGIDADKLNAVPANTELIAVATPADGWELQSLMAGDKDIKSDGKFTVTADVEVKAVFVKKDSPNPPAPDPNAVSDAVFASVVIAPNPFGDRLAIQHETLTSGTYTLLNAQGVVVRSGEIEGSETVLETADLASGVYLLRITAKGTTKTYRLVKD